MVAAAAMVCNLWTSLIPIPTILLRIMLRLPLLTIIIRLRRRRLLSIIITRNNTITRSTRTRSRSHSQRPILQLCPSQRTARRLPALQLLTAPARVRQQLQLQSPSLRRQQLRANPLRQHQPLKRPLRNQRRHRLPKPAAAATAACRTERLRLSRHASRRRAVPAARQAARRSRQQGRRMPAVPAAPVPAAAAAAAPTVRLPTHLHLLRSIMSKTAIRQR